MTCGECGQDRKRSSPCASCRKRTQWRPVMGPNRAAFEEQVEAMATGREHRALVEVCRGLADQVDAQPVFDDKVWREYRLALEALGKAVRPDAAGSSFESLVEKLRAKVPDSEEPEPAN